MWDTPLGAQCQTIESKMQQARQSSAVLLSAVPPAAGHIASSVLGQTSVMGGLSSPVSLRNDVQLGHCFRCGASCGTVSFTHCLLLGSSDLVHCRWPPWPCGLCSGSLGFGWLKSGEESWTRIRRGRTVDTTRTDTITERKTRTDRITEGKTHARTRNARITLGHAHETDAVTTYARHA